MHNLYHKLGVTSDASHEELKQVVSRTKNVQVRRNAEAVLLNSKRREKYDQIHHTVSIIGQMRANLGIEHCVSWTHVSGYTYFAETTPSQYTELKRKNDPWNEGSARQKQQSKSSRSGVPAGNWIQRMFRMFVGYAIAAVVVGIVSEAISTNSQYTPQQRQSPPAIVQNSQPRPPTVQQVSLEPTPVEVLVAAPRPSNGTLRRHDNRDALAPFEIKTSGNTDYFVKLVDLYTGKEVVDIFVRGGQTSEIEVPLGSYQMRYASGQTWYGYEDHFGNATSYNKSTSTFAFTEDSRGYSGYTVTLYRVQNGNMRTHGISAAQF